MNWKEAIKEVGKGFINFGVGLMLFLLVQPFVKGELKKLYLVLGIIGAILSVIVGFIFITIGGNCNDS